MVGAAERCFLEVHALLLGSPGLSVVVGGHRLVSFFPLLGSQIHRLALLAGAVPATATTALPLLLLLLAAAVLITTVAAILTVASFIPASGSCCC